MTLEQFKKISIPKKSRSLLWPHYEDILDLHKNGYTLDQIREYLAQKKIETSKSNLSAFIRRHTLNESSIEEAKQATNTDTALMKKWLTR
ncbi:hypothetical protein KKH82_01165 [Patescibacteria group bacterium]|nr:hypothetical protein [Patescibacteria group bacterium]